MIIKTDKDAIGSYFEDSSNLKGGWADEVVFPQSAEEISRYLAEASREKIPVTVSGGGTATTGARIPFGGRVISLERMNKILGISKDPSGPCARAQAGVLVDELKKAAEAAGLFYTCHPTEPTAMLGGTIATNASGSRSFKYGSTRKFIRSLRIVLATGEIINLRRAESIISRRNPELVLGPRRAINIPIPSYRMPEVKTSAGYYAKDGMDPVDLFIGQEGTLGVVAEMEMALVKSPEELFSCFAFFADDRASWNFARECKRLGPLSVEYLDRNSLNMLRKSRSDIPAYAKASIFFEAEAAKGCLEKVVETWEELLRKYNVSEDDAWAAMSERESEKFLELRHSIPSMVNEIIRARGTQKVSTDIAVPEERFIEMMNFYAESFDRRTLESVIFGHIGESHVHVNMMPRSAEEALEAKALTLEFVRKAVSLGGTVSAEHGIGKIKHAYLEELYGKRGVIEMARIKKALDPAWILGLDNIFSRELVKEV